MTDEQLPSPAPEPYEPGTDDLKKQATDQLDAAERALHAAITERDDQKAAHDKTVEAGKAEGARLRKKVADLRPEIQRLQVIVNSFTPRKRTVKPKDGES